jgi:hypothetical protein
MEIRYKNLKLEIEKFLKKANHFQLPMNRKLKTDGLQITRWRQCPNLFFSSSSSHFHVGYSMYGQWRYLILFIWAHFSKEKRHKVSKETRDNVWREGVGSHAKLLGFSREPVTASQADA